jgi:hypothetical protein
MTMIAPTRRLRTPGRDLPHNATGGRCTTTPTIPTMLRQFIAAAALLATLPAYAQPVRVERAVLRPGAIFPPAEFDKPYDGVLTVITVGSIATLNMACQRLKLDPKLLGCAYRLDNGKTCKIYMVTDAIIRAHGFSPEDLMRHEVGHCHAWPGLHPHSRTRAEAGPASYDVRRTLAAAKDEAKKEAKVAAVNPKPPEEAKPQPTITILKTKKVCENECLTTAEWLDKLNNLKKESTFSPPRGETKPPMSMDEMLPKSSGLITLHGFSTHAKDK